VALLNAPVENSKSLHQDLNQWPSEYQASTLPTELCQMIQYGWKSKYNYWLKLAAAAGATLARPHILKVASPQCPMNVQKYQFCTNPLPPCCIHWGEIFTPLRSWSCIINWFGLQPLEKKRYNLSSFCLMTVTNTSSTIQYIDWYFMLKTTTSKHCKTGTKCHRSHVTVKFSTICGILHFFVADGHWLWCCNALYVLIYS
jgi:hypothetical protein